jgi:hypothetical protein
MADSSLNASTTAVAASLVIKNTPGTLFGVTGYNAKTTAQFIQIHDATLTPAEASIPVIVFLVAATANFSLDFGMRGRQFAKGIVITNSSTAATKTIGSADCWFDAQYI